MPPFGTLEITRDGDWVALRAIRTSGVVEEAGVAIPAAFDDEVILETLVAMEMIARDVTPPRLTSAADVRQLATWLSQTLAYFAGPDEPAPRLWTVIAAVRAEFTAVQRGYNIALEAYAWLDVRLRDELAEEVRAADDLWKEDELRLDLEARRERLVADWLRRFESAPFGEFEPSKRTRGGERREQTG